MRSVRNSLGRVTIAAALAFGAQGCGRQGSASAPAQSPSAGAPATSTVPHGDHNPHHGGVVMMKGDLHYEVVMDPAGRHHRIYFTDAVREDLPASVANDVVVTIRRPHVADEVVGMRIDDSGESWEGSGRAVADPAATTVRVAFTLQGGEPYSIDLPFALPPAR